MSFFGIPCTQLAVTVCHWCYKRSKKAPKKAFAHPKDHLERSLMPIQATQVTPGPLWTRQKGLEAFQTSNKKMRLETYFPLKEPPQFTEPQKQLCAYPPKKNVVKCYL